MPFFVSGYSINSSVGFSVPPVLAKTSGDDGIVPGHYRQVFGMNVASGGFKPFLGRR